MGWSNVCVGLKGIRNKMSSQMMLPAFSKIYFSKFCTAPCPTDQKESQAHCKFLTDPLKEPDHRPGDGQTLGCRQHIDGAPADNRQGSVNCEVTGFSGKKKEWLLGVLSKVHSSSIWL